MVSKSSVLILLILFSASVLLFGCTQTNPPANNVAEPNNQLQDPKFELNGWEETPASYINNSSNLVSVYGDCEVIAEQHMFNAYYYSYQPKYSIVLTIRKITFADNANSQKWIDYLKAKNPNKFAEISPNKYSINPFEILLFISATGTVKDGEVGVFERENETVYAVSAADFSGTGRDCSSADLNFCIDVAFKAIDLAKQKSGVGE